MARRCLVLAILLCATCAGAPAPGAVAAARHTHRHSHHATCSRAHRANWRSHHVAARKGRCNRASHRHSPARHSLSRHRTVAADSNGACPYAGLTPSQTDVELVRAATLCLVNRERQDRGLSALRWNGHLEAAAQAHTESMVQGGYFEHVGPGGDTPLSRMRRYGYIYNSQIGYEVGENIGWGSLWLGTPRAVVAAWMASPGHRANILDPHFRDTGIGVSPHTPQRGQDGGLYTEDFGVIVTG